MTDEQVTEVMVAYLMEESESNRVLVSQMRAHQFHGDLIEESLILRCYYCGGKCSGYDICRHCQRPICVRCRPESPHTGSGDTCLADMPEKEWE